MKNKKYKNNNLDASYENFKNNFQKNNTNYLKNKFHCKNNICRNKMILNKNNYIDDSKNSYTNKTFINYFRNKNDNLLQENKKNNQKITRLKNYCYTPDRNSKYNIGLTPNKNNISLVKVNNRNYKNNIEHYTNKNTTKLFLSNQKRKYNILSNERKALTPNKVKKSYLENNKKIRDSESYKYFNSNKKNFIADFSKSCQGSSNKFGKINKDKYHLFDDSSLKYNKKRENKREKTYDKFNRKLPNLNYKNSNNLNLKNSKYPKISSLNNTSQIKFSNSFCCKNNRKENNHQELRKSNDKNYIFSNTQINKNKKYFNDKNTKFRFRSKSSNYKCDQRNYYKSNDNQRKKLNYKYKNSINNSYFESSTSQYKKKNQKLIKDSFNNFDSSNKTNDFNFSTNYENYYVNKSEISFSQKKANKDLGKYDYPHNFVNKNTNNFYEKAKIDSNKITSKKTYKFIGINNYKTKSSTNTYDEINSSNSNISKNTILDSIEEIHFNFVNVLQSSKNLVKMENQRGDKIIEDNQNSSIILVEERDIE